MRRTPLRFRPSLADALERRAVPSPLGGLSPVAEVRPSAAVRTRQVRLRGTVLGGSMTTNNPMIADIPTQVELSAIARVRPLGVVRLSGSLTHGGYLVAPHPLPRVEGTLTLSNARGSLTLRLESVARRGEPAPDEAEAFRYTIQSGTGAYRRLAGEGAASLTLGPPVESPIVWVPGPNGFNIPKPVPVPGQFALVLHPGR